MASKDAKRMSPEILNEANGRLREFGSVSGYFSKNDGFSLRGGKENDQNNTPSNNIKNSKSPQEKNNNVVLTRTSESSRDGGVSITGIIYDSNKKASGRQKVAGYKNYETMLDGTEVSEPTEPRKSLSIILKEIDNERVQQQDSNTVVYGPDISPKSKKNNTRVK